jgi:hypothetical protein
MISCGEDCPYYKIVYKNTLRGQPFCKKYMKFIPVGHFAYNFFCWDDKYEPKRNNKLPSNKT